MFSAGNRNIFNYIIIAGVSLGFYQSFLAEIELLVRLKMQMMFTRLCAPVGFLYMLWVCQLLMVECNIHGSLH